MKFTKILAFELIIDFCISVIKAGLGLAISTLIALLLKVTLQEAIQKPEEWVKLIFNPSIFTKEEISDGDVSDEAWDLAIKFQAAWWIILTISVSCGVIWWTVCRFAGPSAPREVGQYRYLWFTLIAIYLCGVGVYLLLTVNVVNLPGMLLLVGWYLFGLIVYFVASVAFTPPSVLSVVPGGSLIANLRK